MLVKHTKHASFTLVELLVSISIIIILSGVFLFDYQFGNKKNRDLIDVSHLILQQTRKTQNLALGKVRMLEECGGRAPKSFGIHFSALESSNSKVDIFGDKNNNGNYDFGADNCICVDSGGKTNECFERQILPSGIKIYQIKIGKDEHKVKCDNGWINFLLDDFSIQINGSGCVSSLSDTSKISIELCTIQDCQNHIKNIVINNKGMVEIQ